MPDDRLLEPIQRATDGLADGYRRVVARVEMRIRVEALIDPEVSVDAKQVRFLERGSGRMLAQVWADGELDAGVYRIAVRYSLAPDVAELLGEPHAEGGGYDGSLIFGAKDY